MFPELFLTPQLIHVILLLLYACAVNHHEFFPVKGQINACRTFKGWRSEIYVIAATCFGYYNIDKSQSMFYDGDLLKLHILFKTTEHARNFITKLTERSFRFGVSRNLSFERDIRAVQLPHDPEWVMATDYDTSDFDSPVHSLCANDFSPHGSEDDASQISISNPEAFHLMIENPHAAHLVGLDVYKCHLMSKEDHPDEVNNPNNVIYLSWSMHQRLDGLKTNWPHKLPQIAIGYSRLLVGKEDVGTVGYPNLKDKVEIFIEGADQRMLLSILDALKAGSELRNDKLYTFVHVNDYLSFSICLMTRYEETKTLWRAHNLAT